MKAFKFLLALTAIAAACAFAAHAQTNTNSPASSSNTTTTTSTGISSGAINQIGSLLNSLGISSNPTNYAIAPFFGVKEGGNQLAAGVLLLANATNHFAPTLGFDHLWFGGHTGSANIVSGGLTLKDTTHPFQWLGAGTNTWVYNLAVTPYVAALAGSASGNTGTAGGGLAGIFRTGANVDLLTVSKWKIGVGADYGSRTGSGNYNGNWYDFTVNARFNF